MRRKQDLFAYLDELAAVLVREHGYSERKARGVAETFGVASICNGSSPEQAASIWVAMHTRPTPAPARPQRLIDAHVDDRRRKFDDLAIETVEKALRRVNGKAGG